MNKKLRQRVIQKLAQATTTAPATPVVSTPPPVPEILFSHLNEGYNPGTAGLIMQLCNLLNIGAHYASQGKENFQVFLNNSFTFDSSKSISPDQKNIGLLSKKVYQTFLNSKNPFNGKKSSDEIKRWADAILSSQEYQNLSQVNPTGQLATKLPPNLKNLKTSISQLLTQIKAPNPPAR